MRRVGWLAMMGLTLVTSAAWAQEGAPRRGRAAGGDQMRQGREMPRAGQRGMRGGMFGDIEQAVSLTPEQREQVQALQEKFREQMREQFANPQANAGGFQAQRALRQQMLAAARAGEDAKVEALQKQLDESATAAQRRKLVTEYYDEVEKVLTFEQRRSFERWRKLQDSGLPANLLGNPEAMKTALRQIELTEPQKEKVKAAFEEYDGKVAALTGEPAEVQKARQAATQELMTEVVAVLKPSQKVLLADAAGGARQRGEGRPEGQGGRRGPGGGAGAPAVPQ